MGLGCGTSIVKYVLFVFNFLIALGGIALVSLGIVALVQAGDLRDAFKEHDPTFAAIGLIVLGSVVFLISFFGCCGAIKESHCMTMTYASILLIVFIAQVVIGVLVLINRHDFTENIMRVIGNIFNNPSAPGNADTIRAIEKTFECCGWGGLTDGFGGIINKATCLGQGNSSVDCKTQVLNMIETNAALLGWVAIGVGAIELVALVFACCLGNNIRNAERRLNY